MNKKILSFFLVLFLALNVNAQCVYKLPFANGVAHTCTQGNNSAYNHTGKEKYAFDFSMPINTTIYAARAGTVSHVTESYYDYNGSSNCNYVNRIVIDHGDGTSALYLHLTHNGATANVGDYVTQGQAIAKSGQTGCSTGPHLHFMVMASGPSSWYNQSVQISFCDVTSNNGIPVSGSSYTPNACTFAPPPVLSPADVQSNVSIPVSFDWNDISGSSPQYRIQVSTANSGWTAADGFTSTTNESNTVPVNQNAGSTSSYSWTSSSSYPPQQNTTYYWTVRSYVCGQLSDYSPVRSFTTICNSLSQPNSISGNATVCEGSSQTYTIAAVPGAISYTWSFPSGWSGSSDSASLTTIPGSSGGNISVAANSSCTSGVPGTFSVNVNVLPAQAGTISGNAAVCRGQTAANYTVPIIPNTTSYNWTLPSGATGSSSINSITISYDTLAISGNVTVKGLNNCGDGLPSSLNIIVNLIPQTPIITVSGNVLTSNSAIDNQWYNSSGLINGATSQNYTATVKDDYYVVVTIDSCSSAPSNTINVVSEGLEFYENAKGIIIYPNPATNQITIEAKDSFGKISFEILNLMGQSVYKSTLINKTSVDVNHFSSGIYLVKFEGRKSFLFKKL